MAGSVAAKRSSKRGASESKRRPKVPSRQTNSSVKGRQNMGTASTSSKGSRQSAHKAGPSYGLISRSRTPSPSPAPVLLAFPPLPRPPAQVLPPSRAPPPPADPLTPHDSSPPITPSAQAAPFRSEPNPFPEPALRRSSYGFPPPALDASTPYLLPNSSPPPTQRSAVFSSPMVALPNPWDEVQIMITQRDLCGSSRYAGAASPYAIAKNSPQAVCPICLRLFREFSTTTLSCGHRFHTFCIRRWLSINATCPYCRTVVSPPTPSCSPEHGSPRTDRTLHMESIPPPPTWGAAFEPPPLPPPPLPLQFSGAHLGGYVPPPAPAAPVASHPPAFSHTPAPPPPPPPAPSYTPVPQPPSLSTPSSVSAPPPPPLPFPPFTSQSMEAPRPYSPFGALPAMRPPPMNRMGGGLSPSYTYPNLQRALPNHCARSMPTSHSFTSIPAYTPHPTPWLSAPLPTTYSYAAFPHPTMFFPPAPIPPSASVFSPIPSAAPSLRASPCPSTNVSISPAPSASPAPTLTRLDSPPPTITWVVPSYSHWPYPPYAHARASL